MAIVRHRAVPRLSSLYGIFLVLAVSFFSPCNALSDFLVHPYIQIPTTESILICWVSDKENSGQCDVFNPSGELLKSICSAPEFRPELSYHPTEFQFLPKESHFRKCYLHRVKIEGLAANTKYSYSISMGPNIFSGSFQTVPSFDSNIRFVVYGDSETEPESTNSPVDWPQFGSKEMRSYPVDQTVGYRENLKVIQSRTPNFVAICGDLVEKGGRQLDWDEFWKHNAGVFGNLASHIPIFPALGNHENYAGSAGGYSNEGAALGLGKYKSYFEPPASGVKNPVFEKRFYSVSYGPILLVTLDTSDGAPENSESDTNFFLAGESNGGEAPDFNPGSRQYEWLKGELERGKMERRLIFVQMHHAPYSVGPHGLPAGAGQNRDSQSGQPTRILSTLFEENDVLAVFSGHDEMYEHSIVNGIHYYDIGIGGDGLRGPHTGPDGSSSLPSSNPYQVFLAHIHAPEVWEGKKLVSGGKHYGHLEIDVEIQPDGTRNVQITPVHIFPVMNEDGKVVSFERRIYDDIVSIKRSGRNK